MKKAGISSFFANLWYYYKWHILVGLLILTVLCVTVSQCMEKNDPDLSILYIGDMDIGQRGRGDIDKNFGDCYSDVNGDGNKTLLVTFMGENDPDTKSRLQTEVLAGNHSIFFIDREYFDRLLRYKILAPLEEVLGARPENALNDYGVELKYLDISETGGFDAMPRDTVVCLRSGDEESIDYGRSEKLYKNSVGFFKKLCSYKIEGLKRENVRMALIGDRDLRENCVGDMEESLYYICKQKDPDTAAILLYESMQLKYDAGAHVFGDVEKQAAKELAAGNKLLLLDADVYEYLASEGLLFDIGGLSADLPENAALYGVPLTSLPLFSTDGFRYADDASNGRVYLCASADIDGYTGTALRCLYGFKR